MFGPSFTNRSPLTGGTMLAALDEVGEHWERSWTAANARDGNELATQCSLLLGGALAASWVHGDSARARPST